MPAAGDCAQAKAARAHNNLGLLLAKDGKVDEAFAEFSAAGLRPDEAHQNVAFVMSTERRWDEARRQYELAIAANPASTTARDRLAELGKIAVKLPTQLPEPRRDIEVVTASATQEWAVPPRPAGLRNTGGPAGGGSVPAARSVRTIAPAKRSIPHVERCGVRRSAPAARRRREIRDPPGVDCHQPRGRGVDRRQVGSHHDPRQRSWRSP